MSGKRFSANELDYLTDVLGLNGVVLPDQADPAGPVADLTVRGADECTDFWGDESSQVIFVSVMSGRGQSIKDGECGELFAKMLAAMKLSADSAFFAQFDSTEAGKRFLQSLGERPARIVVLMGEETAIDGLSARGRWLERDGRRYIRTFHPSRLLREPGLKRSAWQHLQQVMRELGSD